MRRALARITSYNVCYTKLLRVWTITQEPNQDFIHYAPGVARPDLLLTLRELFGHVPNHLRDMIGLFGWYELVPPASTLIAWIGSLAVITVLAFAISKRREQIRITSYNVCYTKLLRQFFSVVVQNQCAYEGKSNRKRHPVSSYPSRTICFRYENIKDGT